MRKDYYRRRASEDEGKVYCFICHRELDREMFVLVFNVDDEMICLCRDHIEERPGYAGGLINRSMELPRRAN